MTFTDIVTAVQNRLNLTSTTATTRIGNTVNDRYKRVTSAIGLNLSRRTTVQADMTVGVSTLQFTSCEKIINVQYRGATPYLVLEEVTIEDLRADAPPTNGTPTKYAIIAVDAHSVTILTDCVPQATVTLYADCYGRATTLSGTQEPAFPEDFHDVLVHGALADEYRKMEKTALATDSESLYQIRLSDLRMFIAKSSYLDVMQGGRRATSLPVSGSASGSGSSTNGATSYTQTGLITFDRTSAAVGSRYPFVVVAGSEKVTNLDADKLDGLDSTAFMQVASDETITGLKTFSRGAAVPFAVAAGALNVPNLDADKVDGKDASAFAQLAAANAFTDTTDSTTSTTGAIKTAGGLGVAKAANIGTNLGVGGTANITGATTLGGLLTVNGGQIAFPAVQVPSAGANTLDDYEEGVWVPSLQFGGASVGMTYFTRTASYIKIGQMVMIGLRITLTAKGSSTGTATIAGLPFTADATTYHILPVGWWSGMGTTMVFISTFVAPGASVLTFAGAATASAGTVSQSEALFSNTSDLIISGVYRAAN